MEAERRKFQRHEQRHQEEADRMAAQQLLDAETREEVRVHQRERDRQAAELAERLQQEENDRLVAQELLDSLTREEIQSYRQQGMRPQIRGHRRHGGGQGQGRDGGGQGQGRGGGSQGRGGSHGNREQEAIDEQLALTLQTEEEEQGGARNPFTNPGRSNRGNFWLFVEIDCFSLCLRSVKVEKSYMCS